MYMKFRFHTDHFPDGRDSDTGTEGLMNWYQIELINAIYHRRNRKVYSGLSDDKRTLGDIGPPAIKLIESIPSYNDRLTGGNLEVVL